MKTNDHLEDWVPPSPDITEELLLGNIEPSFLVAMKNNLLKPIVLCTWRMDRSDSGMRKRNGVTINCFIVGLFCGIAWGGFRVELSIFLQSEVGEFFDDMGGTDIYDVREAHNVVVVGIKVDSPSSE
jgi:hypothetical protein